MLIKKSLMIVVALLATSTAFASEPWIKNQGDKPEYSSSLIAGEWLVKEGEPVFKNFKKRPKFIIMSQASNGVLDATMDKFKKQGLRTERLHTNKTKSYVKSIMATANDIDYINKNYSVDTYASADKNKIDRDSFKLFNNYVEDNEENALMLSFYNKKGLIYGTDAMALFLYRNYEVLPSNYKSRWDNSITKIESQYGFDIKASVDFFFLGTRSKLMAMDVVSNDEIIVYNVEKATSVTLVRSKENLDPISYDAYFKQLEK
ncbi:exported hypothetical protein [Vibrio crassostreae]|uniref:hypothetical protein n=1 Tax=Vibrio crassostreae TaxID=246167 RepID=UPI0010522125|nr:hypothetical protein [Vibrio crassostreae]TCT63758.1 hypothetical protein EDB40_101250 [Vibrio crassostreae]CAK2016928.1 exported hypothetical protein [Vibrio crassostreae]CAK2073844.1 exported hypothetical protein [Vibrio crassostreae]CAK2087747.1 exported hypothetical protein [Vibrio crassostreae]CAK2145685.1 exported hypothetical protein [Vibrio crassostreae]